MAKTHKRYKRKARRTIQTVKNTLTGGVWYKPWTWGKSNTNRYTMMHNQQDRRTRLPSPPKAKTPEQKNEVPENLEETASEEERMERIGRQAKKTSLKPSPKQSKTNVYIEDLYAPIGETKKERKKRHKRLREQRRQQNSPLMKLKFPEPPPTSNTPKSSQNKTVSPPKSPPKMPTTPPKKQSPIQEKIETLHTQNTVKKPTIGARWEAAIAATQKQPSPRTKKSPITRKNVERLAELFEKKI